jgi:hypothetical protein
MYSSLSIEDYEKIKEIIGDMIWKDNITIKV